MARAATSRRPPTRSTELAGPAGKLPPRTVTWPRDLAVILAFALASIGIMPLLGAAALAAPVCIAAVAAAVARVYFGRRTAARWALTDRLVEALSPALGSRTPDRRLVRLTRWSRGFPGEPAKVLLRYAPGAPDDDPTWRGEIIKTVGRRLLATYVVDKHDRARLRLHLVLATENPDDGTPAAQARAERTVTELLGASATVTNVEWSGTELVALDVKHEAGVKLASQAYRSRIERVVSTMLPGRWRAKWDLLADKVRFEQRPPLPSKVEHPAPRVDAEHLYQIPLAIGEDGEVIRWNLKGAAPHMIVVGKTGQGKTVVINGAIMEFCFRGWPVRINDPKRIEFMGLRGWPNVQCVATTVEDQVAQIYQTWLEMERRYSLIESGEATEDDFEPMLLVLDEYRDFVGMASAWYAGIKVQGMPARCPAFEWVASLARKGRSAGIHLLLGTQRPDAEFLGGEMRDNFATRVSLGRLGPQGAIMMWEAAYIGVSVPRGKRGRGTAIDDNDNPVEIQAYWTPDPRRLKPGDVEDRAILERLRPAECRYPPMEIELAEDLFDDLDDTGKPPTPAQLEKRMRQAQWESIIGAQMVPVTNPAPDPLDLFDKARPLSPSQVLARGPVARSDRPSPSTLRPASVFDQIQPVWPSLFKECAEAERHLPDSPVASTLHARRALELLVGIVYGEARLTAPEDNDLVSRINDPGFKAWCGRGVVDLMHAIRKAGNTAAHPGSDIDTPAAEHVLKALQNVTAFAYTELVTTQLLAEETDSVSYAEVDEGSDDVDDDSYGPITTVRASKLSAGDLILVDEALDMWGVVASEPEQDEGDDSIYCIEWRSDDDDGGWLELPDDSTVTTRRPLELED